MLPKLTKANVASVLNYLSLCRKSPHPSLSHPIEVTPSNFVVKLTTLKVETLCHFCLKTLWSYLQLSCHNTLASQRDDTHVMTIAKLCNAIWLKMQLTCEKSMVLYLVNSDWFAKQLNHIHDFDCIISVFLANEFHKAVALMCLCDPVFRHVDIHCK